MTDTGGCGTFAGGGAGATFGATFAATFGATLGATLGAVARAARAGAALAGVALGRAGALAVVGLPRDATVRVVVEDFEAAAGFRRFARADFIGAAPPGASAGERRDAGPSRNHARIDWVFARTVGEQKESKNSARMSFCQQ
jgi:hypothetical protein